jgi:hypothetical protein
MITVESLVGGRLVAGGDLLATVAGFEPQDEV